MGQGPVRSHGRRLAGAESLFQGAGEEFRLDFSGDHGARVVRFTLQPE